MPGASAPPICLDGYTPTSSGIYLQPSGSGDHAPPHVQHAPRIDGLVQVHVNHNVQGVQDARPVLEREEPTTVARMSVSLSPERSRTITRDEALSVADDFGIYLDLPGRADLLDHVDDRFLPITGERGVTTAASATGVRVIPENHLVQTLTTPADLRKLERYPAMRGQLRLVSDNVEIGVPPAVAATLPARAEEPTTGLADPVAVDGYAGLMSRLDDLKPGQQATVTARASGRTHEVSARMHPWGLAVSGPLPRHPDSIAVSLPVPSATALSARDLAWLDGIALAIKAQLDDPSLSLDDQARQRLTDEIEGLRTEFGEARKAGGLPDKPVSEVIFEAKDGTLREWREDGAETAGRFDDRARRADNPQERAMHVLRSALHRDFWLETHALTAGVPQRGTSESSDDQDTFPAVTGDGEAIPLTRMTSMPATDAERREFLPLARRILGPSVRHVTDENMATLIAYATEAYDDRIEGGPVGTDSLRRRHGYATLRKDLEESRSRTGLRGSLERNVNRYIEEENPRTTDDRKHELLRLGLHLLANESRIDRERYRAVIRTSDVFLDWAQRRYSKKHSGHLPPGPVPLGMLAELVRDKLGPGASLSSWDVAHIAQASSVRQAWWVTSRLPRQRISRIVSQPGLGMVTQPVSRVHTRFIQRRLDNGDSTRDRNQEVRDLRARLAAAGPSVGVSDEDLARLVATRRRLYAKSWDRRYTSMGLSHYQQMARELLGRDQVTPDVLRDLAVMTRPESSLRYGGAHTRFNHRKIRQQLAEKAFEKWRPGTDRPATRPTPSAVGSQDHSRMVTGFHTIDLDAGVVRELTAWINQSVPFGGNQIAEDVVSRKITSLFGQTLDDGTPLEIAVDGTIYDIRLWAIPNAGPEVDPESLPNQRGLFSGAQEVRSYSFFERANWATQMDATFFDIGAGHRFLAGVRSDAALTYGHVSGSGKRALSSTTMARYRQARVKEDLGWVNLPVNWTLRVQERRTYHRKRDAVSELPTALSVVNSIRQGTLRSDNDGGRWLERTFTDGEGNPVTHTIRYAVPEFNLPYSREQSQSDELKDKTDPDYGTKMPVTDPGDFQVWNMDHGVTRIQLADQVITGVRAILTPEGYAFWKTHLERYLSNDELGLHFANLVRAKGERGYQQTFRVLLESDGRRLSLSLGAKDNSPITNVTKISQVSRSKESRIDDVTASVLRTQDIEYVDSMGRISVTESARVPNSRLVRAMGRLVKPVGHSAGQFIQQSRTFLTRAVRVVGELQVALVEFDLELRVHHYPDKHLTAAGDKGDPLHEESRDVSGFAHVLVHKDDLQKLSTVAGDPTPSSSKLTSDKIATATSATEKTNSADPRWWNPGSGWGLTMDVVHHLEGVETLYNKIVPLLVEGGHLPKAANTARGDATSPWDILQKMPLTGALENNPGLDYRNWQALIHELSEDNLLSRAADVMDSTSNDRGIVWLFRHPASPLRMENARTVTLTAETLSSSFKEQTPYELQYGHMHTLATTIKQAKVSAREGGLVAGAGGSEGGASLQGVLSGQYGSRESENSGRTQSSSVMSDTDGQKMKSRSFTAEIRWHWAVKPAGDTAGPVTGSGDTAGPRTATTGSGTVDARAIILQPDALNDTGSTDSLGRLVVVTATGDHPELTAENLPEDFMRRAMEDPNEQSPITRMDAVAYTVIGTWGAEKLQAAATEAIAGEEKRLSANGLRGRVDRVLEDLRLNPEIRAQQLESFLSTALSRDAYRGFLLRAFTGASVVISVGGGTVGLTAVPVGVPEIVKVWKPYTQQVTEAQAGKETGAENMWQAGGGAGGFLGKSGLKPVIEDAPKSDAGNSELVLGTGSYTRVKGRGKVAAESTTLGKYSGLFQDAHYMIVRVAVVHQVQAGNTVRRVAGEVLLNIKVTDAIPYARLFRNPELIADQIAAAQSVRPTADTRTTTVRPSTAQTHASHGATVWPMLLSGGNGQTGVAPLVAALAEGAAPFHSAGLVTYVKSLPASLNPFMGKLLDGGVSWSYRSDDHRDFTITMSAEQVGPASGSHDGGSGAKSYTRQNDARNESRRWNSGHVAAGASSGMGQPDKRDGLKIQGFDLGFVAVSLPGGFSRNTGRTDMHGSNLLSMEGVRANNLTGYFQNVRFYGTVEESTASTKTTLRNVVGGGRKGEGFDATVKLIVLEPRDGATALGADERPLDFGLSQELPENALLVSVRGLGAMRTALSSEGLGGSGRLKDTSDQLNYESLPKKLGAMLTDEGAWFRSLSTGRGDLHAGSKGFVVRARVAEVQDFYWVEKSELEKYDHGTNLVGNTALDTLRAHAGVSLTVAATPDGFNWVGPTGTVGKQRATTLGTDQSLSDERRAWLRRSASLFVVHVRLQYEVEWPGKREAQKVEAIGYTDIVVSKEDAQALGIPDDALAAAVPAKSRAKVFPGYQGPAAASRDAGSAAAVSAAQRFHLLLRQADAGLHAMRPPAGVSRMEITNVYSIADGGHAEPKGKRPPSERPVVWYELVRSDDELVFVLRVHLTGDPDAVSHVKAQTKAGVELHLNKPGHRLPMADRRLRVEVQFVDAGQAHLIVPVLSGEPPTGQGWAGDQFPAFYAHEVLRAIGATGHQRPRGKAPATVPMEVRDADLQQIMDVLEPMWPWRGVPGGELQPRPVRRLEIATERWRQGSTDAEPFRFVDTPDGRRLRVVPGAGEQVAVRYELVRGDDEMLFVVRVHLTGGADAVAEVRQLATRGVQEYLNDPRHVLPMVNLPMRVEVQFVDAARAHLTVAVTAPGTQMDQPHWAQGQPPAFYAHEVLHFLGAIDHRPPSRRRDSDLSADLRTSLMSPPVPGERMVVLDEDLQQIMDTLAPIYAGVIGDHGPLIRPDGAATAAAGPSNVAESWNNGLSRAPRMPDPVRTPSPVPDVVTVTDLLYAEAMVPVLRMRIDQAERRLSPDDPEVQQTNEAFQELNSLVDEAGKAGELPDKSLSQALLNASFKDVVGWQDTARAKAEALADRTSGGRGASQTRRQLQSVLYRDFLIETSALGLKPEDPGNAQFLPIVRAAFDPAASAVTDGDMQSLTGFVADLIKADQPVTMETLTRRAGFHRLRLELDSGSVAGGIAAVDAAVRQWRTPSPDQELAQRDRRLELRAIGRTLVEEEGTFDPTPANLDSLNRVIESAYRRYAKVNDGARPHGPIPAAALQDLFHHKLGDRATLTWASVQRVAGEADARQSWRDRHPVRALTAKTFVEADLPGLATTVQKVNAGHSKKIRQEPGQADSVAARNAERDALWALVNPAASPSPAQPADLVGAVELAVLDRQAGSSTAQAAPPSTAVAPGVGEKEVAALVAVRRRFYADERDPQYTGLADYQQMASELLGAEGVVGAAELRDLAIMMRRIPRRLPPVSKDRFDDRAARQWLTRQAISKWNSGPPQHRPDPQNPQVAPDARTDRSRMVSAFHAVGEMPFVADLTAWINRAVPFGAGQVTEEVVQRKLASLFGQVLDDGAALEVTVDGNTYDIRLWAVPTRGPTVDTDSLPAAKSSNRFDGKQENRIYGYGELASWYTWAKANSYDAGLVYRAALGQAEALSGARIDLVATLGRMPGKGQRELSSFTPAEFQQLRIKEPLGYVNLPVNWALRVEAQGAGKWREFTFRTGDGALREDNVRYAVAQFQLPYSAEESGVPRPAEKSGKKPASRPDPGYLKPVAITRPEQFPVWELDHAVSRIQLSDAVLSQVQKALPVETYAFWKPYVEANLSNDQLALRLGDILRPQIDRHYQQVFRLTLQADGQRLSLSLTAGRRDQPVNSVTKISDVSQNGETRFDRVQAVVAKTLLSEDTTLTRRATLTLGFRALERYFRSGGRAQFGWQSGDQLIRHHRALMTRAERVLGELQVVLADFTVRLEVHHERDGETTPHTRGVDVNGFAHFMVHKDALAGLATADPVGASGRAGEASGTAASRPVVEPVAEEPPARWWTPGPDWGPTMDYVKKLGGVPKLYDQIVGLMVSKGYLPREAAGVGGATPWDRLQKLGVTGADVNKTGVEYANWELLLTKLNERSLRAGADYVLNIDPAQPGVAWVFSHPSDPVSPERLLTIGLSAATTGRITYVGASDKQVQIGHTSIDTMTTKHTEGTVSDLSGYLGAGGNEGGSFWQGQGGRQATRTKKNKVGETQSTALTSDTDGQKMPSPIFDVDIQWTWVALRNGEQVAPSATVDAKATILQPKDLNDALTASPPAPLTFVPTSDGSPAQIRIDSVPPAGSVNNPQLRSVLADIGTAIYNTLGARGVGKLQEKLIENPSGLSAVAVWNGLNRAVYRSVLLRALAAAAMIPVGNRLVGLSVRPVGRPKIVKVWFPYTQQILESQVGREEGQEGLSERGYLGAAYGGAEATAGNELVLGGGSATRLTGSGTASLGVQTVGSYRGLYQDQKMAVVHTVVINRAQVGDAVVETFGEVILNVLLKDVIANRDAFDGAELLDEHPAEVSAATTPRPSPVLALTTELRPPVSLQHGLSWAAMWPMLYGATDPAATSRQQTGYGKLSERLAQGAGTFRSPGLVALLTALPSWLSPYMAKMHDGGALWRFKADGRSFVVSMWAELVGPAWGSRPGGNGIKVYERGNRYRDASRRSKATRSVGLSGIGTGRPDDLNGGFVSVSLGIGSARGEEQSDTRGSNLLFMTGLRANKLTDFNQMVRFKVTIEETTGRSPTELVKKAFGGQRPARRVSFTVDEEHVVSVPTEGTMPKGAPKQEITFGLNSALPPGILIEGIYGVKNIFEAVESAGVGKAAEAPAADGHLNFETMQTSLGTMLSESGALFTAVSIHGAVLDPGRGGLRVKARFSDVLQLSYMEKAEKEKYDHGTDLVADTDVSTRRENVAGSVTATGPVAPGQSVGGQVAAGRQWSRARGIDHTAWIEHRAWLRRDSSVFFVFALLEYEVTLPGAKKSYKVHGSVGMVVTKEEAIDWGIPEAALRSVVPADKRNKEFPRPDGAGQSASEGPSATPAGPLSDKQRQIVTAYDKTVKGLRTITTRPPSTSGSTASPSGRGAAGPSNPRAGVQRPSRAPRPDPDQMLVPSGMEGFQNDQHRFQFPNLPAEWQAAYDAARPHRLRTERYNPARNALDTDSNLLRGELTTIDFRVREFQAPDGTKVRAFDVHLDLVSSDDRVTPDARAAYGRSVQDTLNQMVNGQHRFDDGFRLHVNFTFDTPTWAGGLADAWRSDPGRSPAVEITDDASPDTDQHLWKLSDTAAVGVHEIMHYLGAKEGYSSADRLFHTPQLPGVMGRNVHTLPTSSSAGSTPYLDDSDLAVIAAVAATAGPVADPGLSDPGPEPEWLRTSLARIERPYEDTPNLLSDMSVPGVRATPPPKDLRATARQQPGQYFVWLSTARDVAVDRPVFEWLNERLEQLAQAGRTPIVVTRGRPTLDDVSGSSTRGAGADKRSLSVLLNRYGVAVVHELPQSSGGLGGLNLDNSWKVRGSTPAAATDRQADATWSRIDAAVVEAARRLARPTVRPVSEAFGALVWGARSVREQFDLLRSRPADLMNAAHLEQAAGMAERVPASMNAALVKPLLRFGPDDEVVVTFTESTARQQPSTLLQAVGRLDQAGKLTDPQEPGGATGDFIDLVQAVRRGADEAEHSRFDFAVSLLKAIGQVKAGRFDDAETFIAENRGRLDAAQKTIWVDALEELKSVMADDSDRGRLVKVLAAVLEC
ncbi:hypothetical protein ACQP2C_26510 [Micromonospora zamorensis]|uniref:hypothetical protein n=1 Tax=Micromonospora zamorensis TaxID=709883 RepID=UPI003D98703A